MSTSSDSRLNRLALGYADFVVKRPLAIIVGILLLFGAALWATSKLSINSNQLELINQNLPEVKEVKRVIDMVGGSGHLMIGLRSEDEALLKGVADDLGTMLRADTANVRTVTWKLPVEFIQLNMVLFIATEDLLEAKRRINLYLRDQLRRANPFFIEIQETEPVKLDLSDLINKYGSIGKKSIRDDYNLSNDRKMLMMLVKPMWDTNQIDKTAAYLTTFQKQLEDYSAQNPRGAGLVERYREGQGGPLVGKGKEVTFGLTGSYKTGLDDSYAISESLPRITTLSFLSVLAIILLFFRKVTPAVLVKLGIVFGTVMMYGFAYVTVAQLNMITSILGAVMLGVGIDFGIHFIYRTRIELGLGKPHDLAIRDAIQNAGRPALVSAIVVGGSFFVLMVSEFRGFSQFGWLAGWGTILTGAVAFAWTPALLILIGRWKPSMVERLIGQMKVKSVDETGKEQRIPNPKTLLVVCSVIVAAISIFAVPWSSAERPKEPNLWERLKSGTSFNYNTRALVPEDHTSIVMQDEINERFNISADPIAYYTATKEDAKVLYDELTQNRSKYPTIDQVLSMYTFVPPAKTAADNVKVLEEWKAELSDIDIDSLPPELQEKAKFFTQVLNVKPFDVNGLPDSYAVQFRHLPTTKPENHGYLTFVYAGVDLWDGAQMLDFVDQTRVVEAGGKTFRAAGLPILYGVLARIVLFDGRLMLLVTAIWILGMHWLDFRKPVLALASVIPLVVGLVVTLGFFNLIGERLNFMNIIVLPILLAFGVSHGLYLLHRFLEGTSPMVALRSVGEAVASSTLTTVAGFAALLAADHNGLKSMGLLAVIGLVATLLVSFTVLAAVLQVLHDRRVRKRNALASQPGNQPQEIA